MERLVNFGSEGQLIYANLSVPRAGAACIIMSHGLESSKDGDKWLVFAPKLYDAGFACLRFSYRGCGEGEERSDGEFEDTTLSGRIRDYLAAIDFIETTEVDNNRLGVIGSSFGGMVALAAQDSRIKALVTLATPSKLQASAREQLRVYRNEEFFELLSGRRLRTRFFRDVGQYDICKAIGEIGCPVLIIHGSADETVPVTAAQDLYASAKDPKRLEIIEGGSHAFDDPDHLEKVTSLTLDWFNQYL